MMEHIKFQLEFLPIPFDKVQHIIVHIFIKNRKKDIFIHVEEIIISDPSLYITPPTLT